MIYFIQAGDKAIKIGFADDVDKRYKSLQTANHEKLKVLHVFKGGEELEEEIHCLVEKYHIRGEWYRNEILNDAKIMQIIKNRGDICNLTENVVDLT